MIDSFHLEKYGKAVVSYNRDMEVFPVLREILRRVVGHDIYFSPTDMGVNVIGRCITNDKIAQQAAKDEIIRRYFQALVDRQKDLVDATVPEKIKVLMNELDISEKDRPVVQHAEQKKADCKAPSACIQIGKNFIPGRRTEYLSPIASTFLNAIKHITGIPDDVYLISESILDPILRITNRTANFKKHTLDLGTVLIALSICSTTNPIVDTALDNLKKLRGTELHATYRIPNYEMTVLNNLGINATCDAAAR